MVAGSKKSVCLQSRERRKNSITRGSLNLLTFELLSARVRRVRSVKKAASKPFSDDAQATDSKRSG